MWGGNVLRRRERYCTAKTTEIAAIIGQNTLLSRRVSVVERSNILYSSAETITTKTHATMGTTVLHLSRIFEPPKVACRAPRRCRGASFREPLACGVRE